MTVRFERDVVTEPLGLFMHVRVTPDVDEQCGVVGNAPFGLAETDSLRQTKRDHALSQHVLHGLAKAQIDAQGESRD
jgi:hypothetical protein